MRRQTTLVIKIVKEGESKTLQAAKSAKLDERDTLAKEVKIGVETLALSVEPRLPLLEKLAVK